MGNDEEADLVSSFRNGSCYGHKGFDICYRNDVFNDVFNRYPRGHGMQEFLSEAIL